MFRRHSEYWTEFIFFSLIAVYRGLKLGYKRTSYRGSVNSVNIFLGIHTLHAYNILYLYCIGDVLLLCMYEIKFQNIKSYKRIDQKTIIFIITKVTSWVFISHDWQTKKLFRFIFFSFYTLRHADHHQRRVNVCVHVIASRNVNSPGGHCARENAHDSVTNV